MTSLDIDLLPDAVLQVGADRVLTGWNQAALDLLGPLDGIRAPLGAALDVRDQAGAPAFRCEWPRPGRPVEWTVTRPADGDALRTSVTASLLGDPASPHGAVLVARPVGPSTGIAVVATVSHELRSPLTSIKGYTGLLLSSWDELTDHDKLLMLGQVHHDADRVGRLVAELLDISRIETGSLVLRRQLVDLRALAASVIEKVSLEYPDLECSLDFPQPFPSVPADPDKVEQVFTNLLENAAKYADPKGVRFVGRVDDDQVRVEVHDRGQGIPTDDLPRVFTKFFRGDHGKPNGTGLGLWISRGLAEAHGGTLDADSTVGSGSGFVLSLPLDEP